MGSRQAATVARFFFVFAPAFDNQVQHGYKEKIQHGRHNHAAKNGGANRMTAVLDLLRVASTRGTTPK